MTTKCSLQIVIMNIYDFFKAFVVIESIACIFSDKIFYFKTVDDISYNRRKLGLSEFCSIIIVVMHHEAPINDPNPSLWTYW